MKKVKALSNFVGSPEENEKFGGQIPENLKDREDKMSEADKAQFKGKISLGTEMTVSDNRARVLEQNKLVEVLGDAPDEQEEGQPAKEKGVRITDNTGQPKADDRDSLATGTPSDAKRDTGKTTATRTKGATKAAKK